MATKGSERPAKGKKKAEDPEKLLAQKFRIKCRFRAIVRLALANAYWLNEEPEKYEGLDNVKKRVAQAMRAKPTKKKKILSLADKALLNKPAQDRTDREKLYIFRMIGGLKCFKRYPNNVKKKLAAVTYFKYYGPNRVIVHQYHEAHAMYFLLSGDVIVTHLVFDGVLNKDVSVKIGMMHTGDLFGEVSLLHNIPRTATCTTVGHCELLVLMRQDFKSILQSTIQASWDGVRHAMSFFSYFDALDEVARREGCIIAKMKSYAANDTILGDGAGVSNFVYFVLSGCCQMIESLQVIASTRLGRTSYQLYDPQVSRQVSDIDLDRKYFKYFKRSSNIEDDDSILAQESFTSTIFKDLNSTLKISSTMGGKDCSKHGVCSDIHEQEGLDEVRSQVDCHENKSETQRNVENDTTEDHKQGELIKPCTSSHSKTKLLLEPSEHRRDSVRFTCSKTAFGDLANLQTYFMQVCLFNPGSTFGLGENMRDRRIVALTAVDCMLLPKLWLMERNTANIWTRIHHFLERKIPNKRQLFESFVSERRWSDFRNEVVGDVVARSHTVNWTSVHDVPYSIRMEEMFDV